MISTTRAIIIIIIVALCTLTTRLLPFVIFGNKKEMPKMVKYLGDILPKTVIAVLVIYCLKSINISHINNWLPSILSVLAVALLHIWKRNNLISIGLGTILYMILIQFVFV